jgi:hypothetical protein
VAAWTSKEMRICHEMCPSWSFFEKTAPTDLDEGVTVGRCLNPCGELAQALRKRFPLCAGRLGNPFLLLRDRTLAL